jgi:poly-gamma-glutamate capsule biosynthesis protein CapA/YwtB (metallophosphatase superfamily)
VPARSLSIASRVFLFGTIVFAAVVGAQEPAPPPIRPIPADTVVQAVESPDPAPPPVIRVCAGGDITLGTNLDTAWTKLGARRLRTNYGLSDDPALLVAPLRPLFADADIVLLNVETAIGAGPARTKCGSRSKNCYAFRGPPASAAALRSLGDSSAVVVGNVANNHARDAGPEGFDATMRHLRQAGILVTGADTLATPVALADSVTVGVLGFYTGDIATDARNLYAVRRHVARAVEQYGTVIVTAHIGAEGIGAQRTRDSTEIFLESRIDRGNPVAFARAAFEAGAALVVGHGPHVLRAAEWFDDRLVFYSLGNLLTYGPFNNAEPINRGVVACADLSDRKVIGADLRATVQRAPGVVERDPQHRARWLIDSLSVLDFPNSGARVDVWGDLRRTLITVIDTAETSPDARGVPRSRH